MSVSPSWPDKRVKDAVAYAQEMSEENGRLTAQIDTLTAERDAARAEVAEFMGYRWWAVSFKGEEPRSVFATEEIIRDWRHAKPCDESVPRFSDWDRFMRDLWSDSAWREQVEERLRSLGLVNYTKKGYSRWVRPMGELFADAAADTDLEAIANALAAAVMAVRGEGEAEG